ncbi:MAG TPA: GTPase, partial [Planctomycetota bacterium]|nr:GTPase [Planctomycetota bacterium]
MLGDTILARASADGSSERAVLRLSGPRALDAVALVFAPPPPAQRCTVDGHVQVLSHAVPAMALVLPAPRSYTGELQVELHVPGSPLLVDLLQRELLQRGAAFGVRPAQPGEFTRRAFEHGRMDLGQVEGVLALIFAEDRAAVARALSLLHGGLADATARLRALLQEALAMVEAGLDFEAGDTGAVPVAAWLEPLQRAMAAARELAAALPALRQGGELLLLGQANAGKSSLCNVLAGCAAVLVDSVPGTTRDVVRVELAPGLALWDAPGDLAAAGEFEQAALQLRDRVGAAAAAALLVVDPSQPVLPATLLPVLAVVVTKADLGLPPPPLPAGVPQFTVSARTGSGIEALRTFLRARARGGAADVGGPQRQALAEVQDALAAALQQVAAGAGGEVLATDLRRALLALDQIAGSHSPEQLLDRIFARF